MRPLETTLRDYDLDLLRVIAGRWDVELAGSDARQAARDLAAAMLDPERAADTWSRLGEDERGALQMLNASGGRMTTAQFTRVFGGVREWSGEMGPAKRKKEAPYRSPAGPAEALYYRGLVATAFDQDKKGNTVAYTYIPTDLRAAIPFTASAETPEAVAESEAFTAPISPVPPPDEPLPVDDTAVDDAVTLLAYLQLHAINGPLRGAEQAYLRDHLLGSEERARLALLLQLLATMDLVAPDSDGVFRLERNAARAWLEARRSSQAQELALAWCVSETWNDLRHLPGLAFEGAWQNDPLLARQAVFHFLEMLPPDAWYAIDDFVDFVKEEAPDFQRPTGEWDSWYIRDEATGEYLRGFESWDRVDGALIRFMLVGPMRWLGLVQLDADGDRFRLTDAGLAALELAHWDRSPDPPGATLAIAEDGTATAPRALSRYDRFTLARVADWVGVLDDGFVYRFSAGSLRRAADAGIAVKHILAFLKRVTGDHVPEPLAAAMQQWAEGGARVTLSRAVILQVSAPEELARLQDEPSVNRYLGRQLGSLAVEVLPGAWPELVGALQALGVLPEVVGLEDDLGVEA